MSKIIVMYTLKPDVDRATYENWTRTTDYPQMRGLTRVHSFVNHRIERPLMGDSKPTVDYVEIFDIPDLAGFLGEDMGGSVVQHVLGEFLPFVDNPQFLIAEEVV